MYKYNNTKKPNLLQSYNLILLEHKGIENWLMNSSRTHTELFSLGSVKNV